MRKIGRKEEKKKGEAEKQKEYGTRINEKTMEEEGRGRREKNVLHLCMDACIVETSGMRKKDKEKRDFGLQGC